VKSDDREEQKRLDGHAAEILEMLVAAGERGVLNLDLWTVCHAVNSRVADLRKSGYDIRTQREGSGIFRYRLIPTQAKELSEFEKRRRLEEAAAAPLFANAGAVCE